MARFTRNPSSLQPHVVLPADRHSPEGEGFSEE